MRPAEIDAVVFAAISEAAAAGAPCPSGRVLGRAMGANEYIANRSLYRLRDSGRIKLITLTHPWRRKAIVPGVGETDWSAVAGTGHAAKTNINDPPMQRLTPERDPWEGDCFGPHNLKMRA